MRMAINLLYHSKRNKHICLPPALVTLLKSDEDFGYDESLMHLLDSMLPGSRAAMLRQYILAAEPPYIPFDRPDPSKVGNIARELVLPDEFAGCSSVVHLHLAAWSADVPLVYECIRLGTDVNCRDSRGRTPLYFAVAESAKLHVSGAAGPGNPLISARFKGLQHIVNVLLEQHADPRLTAHGEALSRVAIAWYTLDVELVELFARHGASEVGTLPLEPLPIPQRVAQWASNLDKVAALSRLAARFKNDSGPSRPPRQCPCLSGKPLLGCHGAQARPYPSYFPCTCDTSKTYEKCCMKRAFEIVEKWDEKRQRLLVVRFDGKSTSKDGSDANPSSSRNPLMLLSGILSPDYGSNSVVLDEMECMKLVVQLDGALPEGHKEKADPAYRYVNTKCPVSHK